MSKPFLCESDTNDNSLAVMNQAWEALLCCTLGQVSDENYNPESIISAINQTYCETASGHITSAQAEFDKLFVKIVCTAFSVCTTAPTKNVPRFESHRKAKTEDGQNLRTFTVEIYSDTQVEIRRQIEKMSRVMIKEISEYRKDRGIPSSLKMWHRKHYDYVHFMRKIEDVRKMIGCNGKEGAIVCTWRTKLSDSDGQRKKGGVSRMFLHQWLILRHFVDVNESKIKFTNVSSSLMTYCIKRGQDEMAFNDCPANVRELCKFIKESDENNEEVML